MQANVETESKIYCSDHESSVDYFCLQLWLTNALTIESLQYPKHFGPFGSSVAPHLTATVFDLVELNRLHKHVLEKPQSVSTIDFDRLSEIEAFHQLIVFSANGKLIWFGLANQLPEWLTSKNTASNFKLFTISV